MATKTLKTVPKISVRIWTPILEKLDRKIANACLRRDAYLDKVLETELPWLEAEVSMANSLQAQSYIGQQLELLPRKLVSLALDPAVVERLNGVCQAKRIVRDAFFNRLFLLLAAGPKTIDRLFFPLDQDWRREVWSEYKHDGPFFQNGFYPLEQDINPFWAIRAGLEIYAESTAVEEVSAPGSNGKLRVQTDLAGNHHPVDSLYTRILRKEFKDADLTGFNCHLPDWEIPDTSAAQAYKSKLDELLESL